MSIFLHNFLASIQLRILLYIIITDPPGPPSRASVSGRGAVARAVAPFRRAVVYNGAVVA